MATSKTAQKKPDPCSFVIFGVTGDLAHRLVVPALYNLAANDLLPDNFCVVGVGRKAMSNDDLRDGLMTGLRQFATRKVDDKIADHLFQCVTCIEADPSDPSSFDKMSKQLDELEESRKTGGNRLFYLATPPGAFQPISKELGRSGMLKENGAWRRLVVEKPFGTDLASAKELNDALLQLVDEHQIYRIDHYLGKETVQNILVLRFANGMFEPIWNRNHIDHIQITVDEKLGVGHRGSFYDATGALRDMVPNHLFQLLSLVAMEPPAKFNAHSVRSEKAEVLAAIQTQSEADALHNSVRGQYVSGKVGNIDIEDYRRTEDVKPESTTETYAALKLTIDNWRWAGVPFYLRTGKRLARKVTEIAVTLRPVPHLAFERDGAAGVRPNQLVLTLQPNEGVSLSLGAKVPGARMRIRPVNMEFLYGTSFLSQSPEAYERLITDAMRGDATLFTRNDEVEAQWRICDPIVGAWAQTHGPLPKYEAGSQGPAEAELLLREGHHWRAI